MSHTLDTVSNYAVPAAAFVLSGGNPFITAAAAGANDFRQNHNLGHALLNAGGSYVGGQLGGAMFPGLGNVGNTLNSAMGPGAVSNFVGNTLPAEIGNIGIGSAVGSYFGSNALPDALAPLKGPGGNSGGTSPNTPFTPTQQANQPMPESLANMSSFTPQQQLTGVATQGVFGGGNGPQEQSYFLNQENRKLVDPQGHVGSMSSLQPIEQSYLQNLGLGGYNDPRSLLEAMSKWKYN